MRAPLQIPLSARSVIQLSEHETWAIARSQTARVRARAAHGDRVRWAAVRSQQRKRMHSRAFMLLRRDLVTLQRFPITVSERPHVHVRTPHDRYHSDPRPAPMAQGVTAAPTHPDSLFHWSARVEGLRGTVWEGWWLNPSNVHCRLLLHSTSLMASYPGFPQTRKSNCVFAESLSRLSSFLVNPLLYPPLSFCQGASSR